MDSSQVALLFSVAQLEFFIIGLTQIFKMLGIKPGHLPALAAFLGGVINTIQYWGFPYPVLIQQFIVGASIGASTSGVINFTDKRREKKLAVAKGKK